MPRKRLDGVGAGCAPSLQCSPRFESWALVAGQSVRGGDLEKKSWKGKVATVTMALFILETVIHAC